MNEEMVSNTSKIVLEDLTLLKNYWNKNLIDWPLIRNTTNILRKLFCETSNKGMKNFLDVWDEFGFVNEPKISFMTNRSNLQAFRDDKWNDKIYSNFYHAYLKNIEVPFKNIGEVKLIIGNNRLIFANSDIIRIEGFDIGSMRFEIGNELGAIGKPEKEKMYLSNYFKSECLYVFGKYFTRIELIRCISDKLGGVHLDDKKTGSIHKCNLLDIFDKLIPNITIDRIVENAKIVKKIFDFSPTYFQLLAIGRCIINSNDIKKLMERIKERS